MKSAHTRDEVLEPLQILERLAPDAARAEQVRRRCREVLARGGNPRRPPAITPAVMSIVVGCLGLLYLSELMGIALRVTRVLD